MDIKEHLIGNVRFFTFYVGNLACYHSSDSCSLGDLIGSLHSFGKLCGIVKVKHHVLGHGFKGCIEKAVTGKNCQSLTVNLMVCGKSPSQIIIIHGGKIVMDERICMDILYGCSIRDGILYVASCKFAGCHKKYRSQSLSSGLKAVFHRIIKRNTLVVYDGNEIQEMLVDNFLVIIISSFHCKPLYCP